MPIINLVYEWYWEWKPNANTVLYYSFNEDTATTVYDNSWHSYNWTRAGSNWVYSNLTVGKYTVFSWQTNQIINIPTSFTYPTTNYTFSFWVKYNTNSPSYARWIFSKWSGNNGTGSYLLIQEYQWKIRADIPYVVGDIFICNTVLNDDTWHHIAMVKDGTSWYTYADKTLVNTNTWNYNIDGTNTTSWIIWKNQASYWQQFLWWLDEFIIESKARTAQEVSDYYNQTKSNYWL